MKRTAVIVGGDGQDGTILKEKLEQKKYKIISLNKKNIDICNYEKVTNIIKKTKPHEIYYLAAHHNSSEKNNNLNLVDLNKSIQINFISPIIFLNVITQFSPTSKFFLLHPA